MNFVKYFIFIFVISFYAFAEDLWMDELNKAVKDSGDKAYWFHKSSPNKDTSLTPQLKEGKRIAMTVCAACHGVDGIASGAGNSAIIPNLIAQNKGYLVARLKDYKSGKIKHDQMSMIAQMISEKDIDNVATWYSSIQIVISEPKLPKKLY